MKLRHLLLGIFLLNRIFCFSQTIDLLIGNSNGICFAYQNTGTIAAPTWAANAPWNVPDVGFDSYPSFGDLDNDGDFDLIVGENVGASFAYENIGDCFNPIWSRNATWDPPVVSQDPRPWLSDFDNDGDLDLFIGDNLGISFYYENTGTITNPIWTANAALNLPDVGLDAAPVAADFDNDGDLDLLIGERQGVCFYYENTGTVFAPVWVANPLFDTPDIGLESFPAVGDLDNDGDLDLLIGSNSGATFGYENTGTNIAPVWTANIAWNPPVLTSESGPVLLHLDDGLSCTPLPIELLYFEAELENEFVKTYWSTATEINNDYFSIQRSQDALNFEQIGTVQGAGNSSTTLNYVFYDEHPYQGLSYYRLKQVDFDGTYSYSQLKAIYLDPFKVINVYPNPAKGFINILVGTPDDMTIDIVVFNSIGQKVIDYKENIITGHHILNLNTSSLSSGNYVFKITTPSGEHIEKEFIRK